MILPNKDHEIHYAACNISSDSGADPAHKHETFASRERGTFLVMEPRDESLMRKAKVRKILKTFQEEQPEEQKQPATNIKPKR
jgi:hypothetical protein